MQSHSRKLLDKVHTNFVAKWEMVWYNGFNHKKQKGFVCMTEQNLYFDGATGLSCTRLGQISKGQDGAIYNGLLFRFDSKGNCRVYDLQTLTEQGCFALDQTDLLMPHSNSVFFGKFYSEKDEFPLLYTNIYNNYARQEDRLAGVCCVYRIFRNGDAFSSQLMQVIRVEFTHTPLWRSTNETDVRPYGNFVADVPGNKLYIFTMRDEDHTTRFFRFPLPDVTQGEVDPQWDVPVMILNQAQIEEQFDSDYVNYMQGAICNNHLLYSLEGFTHPNDRGAPKIRVFNTKTRKQVFAADFTGYGLLNEPELIDIYNGKLYYVNHNGDVYNLAFTGESQ